MDQKNKFFRHFQKFFALVVMAAEKNAPAFFSRFFSAFIRINKKPFGPATFITREAAEKWLSKIAWVNADMRSIPFDTEEVEDGQRHFYLTFERAKHVYLIPEKQKDHCYDYVYWMLGSDIFCNGIDEAHVSEWRILGDGSVELVDTDAFVNSDPTGSEFTND